MFEKSSGYVVLVDVDGYTDMKISHSSDRYLPVMERFFLSCEAIIADLKSHDGAGYIIGDGALFFFDVEADKVAYDIIVNRISSRLRKDFHEVTEIYLPDNTYKLSFSAGYCDYHIRRGVDLVGSDIDRLFGLVMNATDEAILLNQRLVSRFEMHGMSID